MAPKKKKTPANGYFYFLMDLRKKMSIPEADKEAARLWPIMPDAQKQRYHAQAKQKREVKYTALNENMDSVQKDEAEEKNREQLMKEEIEHQVSFLNEIDGLASEYFHIIHFNNFFTTTDGVYYPAEVALLRFNFVHGVLDENVYSVMIKPGEFPVGYMRDAKINSMETHKIPYMHTRDSNSCDVIKHIFDFMSESAELSRNPLQFPPIYVKDDFKNLVTNILTQMADNFGHDAKALRIYSLSCLMFTIRNQISNTVVWPSISQSINEFDRDVYEYTPHISCEYHDEIDCPVHCSRSHVIRMAYILCDNCCQDMGIALINGHHVPMDADTSRRVPINNTPTKTSRASTSTIAGSVASASIRSTEHSYKSNVNSDYDFDDSSTLNNDSEWTEVVSTRHVSHSAASSVAGDPWGVNKPPSSSKPPVRGPRTDWRVTSFGRGRGRGVAQNREF